jgi:NhaP-type Na+/H+ and K+/H+ antiporter
VTDLVTSTRLLEGLALAVILAVVARPIAVGQLLMPMRLRQKERLFVICSSIPFVARRLGIPMRQV